MNKPRTIRSIKWILFLIIVIIACFFWPGGKRYAPGVLIPSSPTLVTVEDGKNWTFQSKGKQYIITSKAKYALEARVLSINKEYGDTRIGPVDIVVGWGVMSDQKVLDQLKIWQDNTRHWYCSPRGSEWPISSQDVAFHAVNTHIIPANRQIEKHVLSIRRGDLIDIEGFLVDVSTEGGFYWRTSVGPSGFGEHSCKIIWVESMERH